jgi:hypothetical protein
MKVILLGAGASKAYEASPTKVRMPIAKDFFETYRSLAISENTWVLIGFFINYLRDFHNVSVDDFLGYNGDIEEIHSEVEEKLRLSLVNFDKGNREMWPDCHVFFKVYTELIFLFTSVLNEIQNGPPSKPHLKLVSQICPEDIIVTFNWDTLMDRALATSISWNCRNGYFVKPLAIYSDKWIDNNNSPVNDRAPLLLKLHGSTNWLTGAPIIDSDGKMKSIQEINMDDFFVYERTTAPYSTYDGRYMSGYEDYSYGYYPPNLPLRGISLPRGYSLVRGILRTEFTPKGTSSHEGLTSIPLIIPPVKSKSYEAFGNLFKSLWEKAEDAIAVAEEIIIIGYSFPITDIQSEKLFSKAFIKRSNFPRVTIVNPFPEAIRDRFIYNFGLPEKYITVIKEYFTEDFDVSGILT